MKVVALYISPDHNFFGHHGRPAGENPILSVDEVACVAGHGLKGDRFFDYKPGYSGQVSFFAQEVHEKLCREFQLVQVPSSVYRRNVVTCGCDLNELIGKEFELQGVKFFGYSECKPCYWMDRAVVEGAERWLRGHGGLRARVLSDGPLRTEGRS
ncbi:MAG TPA: molybdenum cofactor biosysynthesis protein [Lacunisphaera sp.]